MSQRVVEGCATLVILGGTAATGGGAQVGVTGQAHPACRAGGAARYLIT